MGGVNWKDAAVRAVKTFVQAFIAAVPATLLLDDLDALPDLLYAGVVAGGAAALAYVWNVLLTWSNE